ncbi:MAG: Superoxide dismutase [uncultured bacterium]|nr:MAG: Superoxide dismutase [uncultured bacterium]
MYEAQKFEHLLGLEGFSEKLLKNHFTLYEGYVANVNKVSDAVAKLASEDKMATPEFAELTRRLGWEFNGMRLHELYFGNLMKDGSKLEASSPLGEKIVQDFGSIENWEKQFRATGAMRGIGWVVLYYDQDGDRLFNAWINEHDSGHFAGAVPILVMDVFEHAYMTDYEIKKVDYIEAFMKNICFHVANARFNSVE